MKMQNKLDIWTEWLKGNITLSQVLKETENKR